MMLLFFGLWFTLIGVYVSARMFYRPIKWITIQDVK